MNLSAFGSDLSWRAAKSSSSTIMGSANNDTHRKNRVFQPWTHVTYHFDFQLHPTRLYSPTQPPLRLRAREKCDLKPFNYKVTHYEPKISQCTCIYHDRRVAARVPKPWVKVDAKFRGIKVVSAKSVRTTLLKIVLCIGLCKNFGQISKFTTAIKILVLVLLNPKQSTQRSSIAV